MKNLTHRLTLATVDPDELSLEGLRTLTHSLDCLPTHTCSSSCDLGESWQEKWHWVSSVACRWWAPSFEAVLDCTRCSPLCAGWEQPGVGWPPFGGKPWLCWNEASDTRSYGCSLLSSELSCLRIKVVGNLNIEYKREKDTKSLLCSFFSPPF